MLFVLQTPSVQHVARVKIVTALWSQRDIFIQIPQSLNGLSYYEIKEDTKKWKEMEEKVKGKVSALPLPEPSKKELAKFIKPIGMEIIAWYQYHNLNGNSFQSLDTLLPQQLCWTMHGTVDYAKTAELMVKDERVDVESRYEIACINCLEDEARELFRSMDAERKWEYVNNMQRNKRSRVHQFLLNFFTRTLIGDVRRTTRAYQSIDLRVKASNTRLFQNALESGGRAMCEYWFAKLRQREKERVLEDQEIPAISCMHSRASSWLYYLSLMSEEQREGLFRECARDVLKGFLRWPMQSLFVEAAECGWGYMNRNECTMLLNDVSVHIQRGFNDYDYPQLFWELWRLCPVDYKQHFLNNLSYLECLFMTKEEEFIKLVFNEAPSRQLKEFVQTRYDEIRRVLMDENSICEAALKECKETTALMSSNEPQDEEKRLRCECVSRLVDLAMGSRMKSREVV